MSEPSDLEILRETWDGWMRLAVDAAWAEAGGERFNVPLILLTDDATEFHEGVLAGLSLHDLAEWARS